MAPPSTPPALFAFENQKVRVYADELGNPWFAAVDVCRVLEISNSSDATSTLGDDEKGVATTDPLSPGGQQTIRTVSESGLYGLVFKSRKPEAHVFRRWITREVIPAIRKTGSYSIAGRALPQSFPEALRMLADAEEQKAALAIENATLKPKAEFFDAVASSDDTLGMNETAKLLGLGRNIMMKRLRCMGVLMGQGDRRNTPYQRYIDEGYFRVIESKWEHADGGTHLTLTTRVFQRGVEFLRKKLTHQLINS